MGQPTQPPNGTSNTNTPALTALSLTHILYDPSSPISTLSALFSLLPQALLIIFTTLIYSTREIEILLFLAGQLLSEGINLVLKKWFKEHRPTYLIEVGALKEGRGYGMPSSHSQFMGFFAVYASLLLLGRLPTSTHGGATFQNLKKTAYLLAAWGSAAAVGLSRVELKYHTVKQVLAGWIVGVVLGLVWFWVTGMARRMPVVWELGMRLWGFFWGRDLMMSVDLVEDGWRRWQEGVARKSL